MSKGRTFSPEAVQKPGWAESPIDPQNNPKLTRTHLKTRNMGKPSLQRILLTLPLPQKQNKKHAGVWVLDGLGALRLGRGTRRVGVRPES